MVPGSGPRPLVLVGLVGLVGLTAVASLAACADDPARSGDGFPIYASRAAGGFILEFTSSVDPGGSAARPALVDVLSPVTVIDLEGPPPRREELTLGLRAPTVPGGATVVQRARFDTTAFLLHPCASAGPCPVGDPAAPTPIGAVIGTDTLSSDAIRFEPDSGRIFVFDEIGGDDEARDRACDALLPAPFYGGGTLVVGDTEVAFDGLRIAVDVCLMPRARPPRVRDATLTGTDAAMVLSTGIGVSILGEARYEQWRLAHGAPPLAMLPATTALLPAGPISGRLATMTAIDISGGGSISRGACHDAAANRLLSQRNCVATDDCPCPSGDPLCAVPSVLELVPTAPIEVVVVPDTAPVLQALRAEVRPRLPEIDGILGMNALAGAIVDVDYPHNRVLMRCVPPPADCVSAPRTVPACLARPTMRSPDSRPVIAACVAAARCQSGGTVP